MEGLRARLSIKPGFGIDRDEDDDDVVVVKSFKWWRRRLLSSMAAFSVSVTWRSALRFGLLLLLLATVSIAFMNLPIDKVLKHILLWIKQDLGPWGPLVLAVLYIPLTILAVPASILTLGGGYLFGLPVGFVADLFGATIGATAAFIVGRTIGRSYVMSKLKNYPKFQAVAVAIRRSGFKIVLLLRLVPLLPFNMLNYLLSVTTVRVRDFMLASLLGMMPITFALVYVGTTLKDLSDVTHEWNEVSTARWVLMALGVIISAIMLVCAVRVAKSSLDKALAENAEDGFLTPTMLPIIADPHLDSHAPLIIKIDSMTHDK